MAMASACEEDNGIEAVQTSLGTARISTPGPNREISTTAMASGSNNSLPVNASGNHESFSRVMEEQAEEEKILTGQNQNAVDLDLSRIRGIQPPEEEEEPDDDDGADLDFMRGLRSPDKKREEQDLEALAELVPGLKKGKVGSCAVLADTSVEVVLQPQRPSSSQGGRSGPQRSSSSQGPGSPDDKHLPHLDSMAVNQSLDDDYEQEEEQESLRLLSTLAEGVEIDGDEDSGDTSGGDDSDEKTTDDLIKNYESKKPKTGDILDESASSDSSAGKTHASDNKKKNEEMIGATSEPRYAPITSNSNNNQGSKANPTPYHNTINNDTGAGGRNPRTPPRDSNVNDESYYGATPSPGRDDMLRHSSAASLSTATQSHEVRMPMYLPNFRPATGCTNASDFIVRCFVARLRAGITVVKHGRSRWCKSRLRVLHVHSDGRSLSWRPAQGEPTSNKRPPKLDLSTCLEVRHAWSPDPLNPMFTGTPILRSKCEASNAFKSFALIFPRRTVDITAVTADQCKVLMEGFSALCFRLQVANMAGRNQGVANVEVGGEGGGGGDEKAEMMTSTGTTVSHKSGHV